MHRLKKKIVQFNTDTTLENIHGKITKIRKRKFQYNINPDNSDPKRLKREWDVEGIVDKIYYRSTSETLYRLRWKSVNNNNIEYTYEDVSDCTNMDLMINLFNENIKKHKNVKKLEDRFKLFAEDYKNYDKRKNGSGSKNISSEVQIIPDNPCILNMNGNCTEFIMNLFNDFKKKGFFKDKKAFTM